MLATHFLGDFQIELHNHNASWSRGVAPCADIDRLNVAAVPTVEGVGDEQRMLLGVVALKLVPEDAGTTGHGR